MADKRVYLETMGCQMNVLDSELVLGLLHQMGYEQTDECATADVVLLNTCSVRKRAEDKVYSRLGEIKQARKSKPDMIVGVIGCMAQRDPDGLRDRAGFIQLICGPNNLNEIPALLEEITDSKDTVVSLEHNRSRKTPKSERTLQYDSIESLDLSRSATPSSNTLQSYVRVQRGCDKFCTFCVVPFTRGPERSRDPKSIVTEVQQLVDQGAQEITLLGQTINSYSFKENARVVRFAELLERVHEVKGYSRLRYVTSYPGEFGDDILEAMRDLPKLCEYLHIPVQSGSNDVLKRMKRLYTVEEYFELIDKAREFVPDISLASDFIVGFTGETDADHQKTLDLIERVRYKNIFMFKYSLRPGTAADRHLIDDIPESVKKQRHLDLVALQQAMSTTHHQAMIDKTVEVLVEGYSKAAIRAQEAETTRGEEVSWKRSDQLTGRTRGDEIAVFTGDPSMIGKLVNVKIHSATSLTLHGDMVTTD